MTSVPTPGPTARSGFVSAVVALIGGTVIAHALTAAALPVLSRLYSPSDFGLLAVLSGAVALVAVAAGLRYDIAVAIPDDDDDALHLAALAAICTATVSAVLGIIIAIAPQGVASLLGQPSLAPLLWLMPVGVLLASLYSALQFWHGRRRQFTLLARTRVVQAGCSSGTQIGLGWLGAGPAGLLSGLVVNPGLAVVSLGWPLLREVRRLRLPRLRSVAIQYSRFPKYSSLEALANSATIQLPIIMIAALAARSEAGFLAMAMYAMQAPMALMGSAIGQVFVSGAPAEHRAGRLGIFTAEIVAGLMKVGIGPLLSAGLLAPGLFALVLGSEWERAGHMVLWMTPWFIMQFLAAPVSMALHVAGHQRSALVLQVAGIAIRVGAVLLATAVDVGYVVEAYALSGFVFYLAYFIVIAKTTAMPVQGLWVALRRAAPLIAAWLAVSAAVAFVLSRHVLPHG